MLPSPTPTNAIWDIITVAVYLAVSVALGIGMSGRQRDLKTYLLAGHQAHWSLIAISVLAALFSGISYLGAPSETFNHNLVYLWAALAYMVATPITTRIFLPLLFRLNFFTAYEYLQHRFDLKVRRFSSASFVFRVVLWLALALYAPSLVVAEMSGMPFWMAILLSGGLTLLYTTIGGMRAVIYTDVMQFAVLMGGIFIVLFVALKGVPGGVSEAWSIADAAGRTRFFDWNLSLNARMTVLGAFIGGVFVNLVGLMTDQVAVQRYLTARSLKESQRALWFKLWLVLPVLGLFYATGLILYAYYQLHPEFAATLTDPDRLIPHFVSRKLTTPLPGLMIAAILAATMSTISAGINSLTTATLMDFVYTGRNEAGSEVGERRRVRIARLCSLGYGVLVVLAATVVSRLGSFIDASTKISGFLGGPLLGVFALGILSRRANANGTLIGGAAGFAVVMAVGLGTQISFMWYSMIGTLVTYGVGAVASRFFAPPNRDQRAFSLYPMEEPEAPQTPTKQATK